MISRTRGEKVEGWRMVHGDLGGGCSDKEGWRDIVGIGRGRKGLGVRSVVVEEGFGLGRRGDGLRGFYKERELWRGMEAGECRGEVGDM